MKITMTEVFTQYFKDTSRSFYDWLATLHKSGQNISMCVTDVVKYLSDKPISVLNRICNDSINYKNKHDVYIEFASCVLEGRHSEIDPQILHKYYEASGGLKYGSFPILGSVVNTWKDIKFNNTILLDNFKNIQMSLESYLQALERHFNIKFGAIINYPDFDSLNDADWNFIVKKVYELNPKETLEYLNNNTKRIQDWEWIGSIIEDKLEDVKYCNLVMSYNNRCVKQLRKRTMCLEAEVKELKANDPINRIKAVKITPD